MSGLAATHTPKMESPIAERPRAVRRGKDIHALKQRDNTTNFLHLARVYLIIAATLGVTIWSYGAIAAHGLGWWWNIPMTIVAIFVIGASQHQFGGAVHEGTHYTLFANRNLNELASDWLAAFPIFTSTYHFRLHHLAHHQFINDPLRDPDWSQLEESGHDLDFPITHVEMTWALLKQLWLPNLFRYVLTRARYSSLGSDKNPYADPARKGSSFAARLGVLVTVGLPAVLAPISATGNGWEVAGVLAVTWLVVTTFYLLVPDHAFPAMRLAPVTSMRTLVISRMSYAMLLYGAISAIEVSGHGPAWMLFGILWIVPLFTTFPLFMIMRQWVQHGNADRGRLTNTRVFLVNPFLRYAIFPWGMDYHLPHHIYASVPHYRLKDLHALLQQDPEYRDKGIVVEGYFHSPHEGQVHERPPTVLEVLGPAYAPHTPSAVFVDNAAIAEADLADGAAIQREAELSERSA